MSQPEHATLSDQAITTSLSYPHQYTPSKQLQQLPHPTSEDRVAVNEQHTSQRSTTGEHRPIHAKQARQHATPGHTKRATMAPPRTSITSREGPT